MRAKRAIIASQKTRRFARLAWVLRRAKNARLRMTIQLPAAAIFRPVGQVPFQLLQLCVAEFLI
jgi:hypothetical protein